MGAAETRQAVRSASDPQQVKKAARRDDRKDELRRDAIRFVLSQPLGRTFLWNLLEEVGVYRTVMDPIELAHYNAGRQDVGHKLMADLIGVDADAYDQMTKEARIRARRTDAEIEAAHTPNAEEQD